APRLVESTFSVASPDYHVDLAVMCDDDEGAPRLVVLVEVQLEIDAAKTRSWPLYQAAARSRWKCDACVLVAAMSPRVAAWAATPIALGPGGSVFRALVLGPAQIPRAERGAPAELALLSAIAHGRSEPEAITVAMASIAALSDDRAKAYFDLLRYNLGDALDRAMEALMATGEQRWLSDFANKYYGEGLAKGEAAGRAAGRATALVTVLTARGLTPNAADRARIESCTDVAALDRWLARAVSATTVDAIFAE
ncbi:MAG: hypothetical protein ACHREM_32650, partial [Polyangiales bacterium]